MNSKQLTWSGLKVGIVVLIGLIIFVFLVSIVGTEQNVFSSTYTLRVFLPNVQGLVKGAQVSLGGLKIGFVRDMVFASRDSVNGVDVSIELLTKYASSVTISSVGQIKTIGLLGDKYIDITIGNPGEPALAEGAYMPVTPSFDLEAAGPALKKALADFTDVLQSVKGIAASIDRGEGSVGRFVKQPKIAVETEKFLASLNRILDAVERKEGVLGRAVYDESLARNIGDVSVNLKTVTDQLRQGKGTMGKLLMDDKLYTSLTSFTTRADSILGKANDDSSSVSRILRDPEFYNRVVSLMRDLNLLLVDLKENPGRYIHVSVF